MEQTINTLLLPLRGFHVVLPQALVAEITQRPQVRAVREAPQWMLGTFDWRATRVPLLRFESLCERGRSEGRPSTRIAILYGLEGMDGLAFYAMELHAIPHPLILREDMLSDAAQTGAGDGVVVRDIRIGGQPAVIPDAAAIERRIHDRVMGVH
jgi:chemosensory pili system protein ChpC